MLANQLAVIYLCCYSIQLDKLATVRYTTTTPNMADRLGDSLYALQL